MPDLPRVRIGFIGAGSICRQRHLPGLAAIEDVEVVAVCNRSEASSRRVAEDWHIADIETDWRTLIARDDLDAVFIGTWPYMHREMCVAALDAGKHVFCQARMAGNLADAEAMLEAADRHGDLVNMVCPPPHRMPWEPFIRKTLDEGTLGEIRAVRLLSINDANADPNAITWREQVEYSGRQELQVGIWAETVIAWLGEYASLCATVATPLSVKRDADGREHEIQIPQIVFVQGQLENGAVISEQHSGLALHGHTNHVVIEGSLGTLRVDAMNRISFAAAGEPLEEIDVPGELQRGWQVEADFIHAVRAAMAGKPGEARRVSPDFREAIKYMKKIEAVHLAAERGCVVRLADL